MLWINISRLTWLELWQSRTYRILLVLALLAPLGAIALASLFMTDIGKVYVDGIAGASQVLAIVFLLFLAVSLLTRDVYGYVCYLLLIPPVTRTDYFVGRFLGLALAFFILLVCLLVSSGLAGVLFIGQKFELYQSGFSWLHLAQMLFFHFFQYISILGIIFFIVSWSSGDAEAMLFTVSVMIFTWVFPPILKAMQNPDVAENTPAILMNMLKWIYEVLPHLQGSDISLKLAHGISIGYAETILYVLEHAAYGLTFLILGLFIFKRRDL